MAISHQFIMSALLERWDWFDSGLQNFVRATGVRPLTKTESMMILYVSAGLHRPIELSKKMRLSPPAIRHISNQLIDLGLLAERPDPSDARCKILEFTEDTMQFQIRAQEILSKLESVLRSRIGKSNLDALRRILRLDWGEIVRGDADLAKNARVHVPKKARTRKPSRSPNKSARARTRRTSKDR